MNIGLLASNAAKAHLESQGLATVTNFYSEIEDPENADENQNKVRELPCVVCFCAAAQEYPMGTGNYNVTLAFRVEASGDDTTAEEFAAIYDEVWAVVNTDTIITDLNSIGSNFTVFGLTGGVEQSTQTIEERIRIKAMTLPLNCCPRDVS